VPIAILNKAGLGREPKRVEEKASPDMFVAHQLLGTGSFGEVYLVEKTTDKQLYAMKVLSKAKIRK
jgi:serine/threonine protein kinase